MKWIEYKVLQCVVGETTILTNKKLGYSEDNVAIAVAEAYDGKYEIVEDGESFDKETVTIEDKKNPGCFYRMIDGEKEWVNPPMITNVEYRTSERNVGRPVYTKICRLMYVEPGDEGEIDFNSEGLALPLRCNAYAFKLQVNEYDYTDGGRTLNMLGFVVDASDNQIHYKMPDTVDRGYCIDVQVWYIKV